MAWPPPVRPAELQPPRHRCRKGVHFPSGRAGAAAERRDRSRCLRHVEAGRRVLARTVGARLQVSPGEVRQQIRGLQSSRGGAVGSLTTIVAMLTMSRRRPRSKDASDGTDVKAAHCQQKAAPLRLAVNTNETAVIIRAQQCDEQSHLLSDRLTVRIVPIRILFLPLQLHIRRLMCSHNRAFCATI